jgi:U6 snRNA-associated Sm-like protein LSm1
MSGGAVDAWQVSAVASLVEELDKKILVVLRDGSKIIGFLRSFDQFANIVLENAAERIIVGSSYSDIPLGLYIVRGENVVLMGEIDETIETDGLTEVSNEEIKREREAEKATDMAKGEMLKRMDFLED